MSHLKEDCTYNYSQQMRRPLNETKTPLVSNIIERAGPGIVINSKALGMFSPLTSFCNSITILSDRALRKNRDSYKAPLLISLENISQDWG